jgi:hypothetical protein
MIEKRLSFASYSKNQPKKRFKNRGKKLASTQTFKTI